MAPEETWTELFGGPARSAATALPLDGEQSEEAKKEESMGAGKKAVLGTLAAIGLGHRDQEGGADGAKAERDEEKKTKQGACSLDLSIVSVADFILALTRPGSRLAEGSVRGPLLLSLRPSSEGPGGPSIHPFHHPRRTRVQTPSVLDYRQIPSLRHPLSPDWDSHA